MEFYNFYLQEKVGKVNEIKRHIDFCNEIASTEAAKLNENLRLTEERSAAEIEELEAEKSKMESERKDKLNDAEKEKEEQNRLEEKIENQQKETAATKE